MPANVLNGRILVTGGAGLIGSAVIWFLNRQLRENILVADILDRSSKWKNLAALSFFDYIDGRELRRRLREAPDSLGSISCVFHLGACSDTCESDADYLMDNNYALSCELAQWGLSRQVRLLFASSAATYGDGKHGFSEEVSLQQLRPLNVYGYSKHLFDLHAEKQGWHEHLLSLKYFNVYGPNEQHKGHMRSMVNKASEQINISGRIGLFKSYRPEYADGEQRRDFLYVKEAAEITVKLATSRATGVYNLGSGTTWSWNELAQAVFDAHGQLPQIDYIDMPDALRDCYQYHTQADLRKLTGLGLDYQKYTLREGVFDYVRNYLQADRRLGDESY